MLHVNKITKYQYLYDYLLNITKSNNLFALGWHSAIAHQITVNMFYIEKCLSNIEFENFSTLRRELQEIKYKELSKNELA